jgi:ubiquinone/menaquinone biosynthesis C-methylase UbiE
VIQAVDLNQEHAMAHPHAARKPLRNLLSVLIVALAIGAAPMAAAGTGEEPDLATLRADFEKAVAKQDYTAALAIAEETYWVTAAPHIETLYAIAAMHARLGQQDEAYEWMQKCLDAGFWDFRKLRDDEVFAELNEQEEFRKMARLAWTKQYIEMLEREEREEFQQPTRVMETLAFEPGERVADVGAGSGYFTVLVSAAVGPKGSVLATDIRQEMLDYLGKRIDEAGIENVTLALVPGDDPQLPAGSIDTILMVDVWHYIRDPEYAKKLAAGLAPGGRLVVIDYRPRPWEERPWGPPPSQQTPREELDGHMAEAGLVPVRVHDFLSEQYFVEYRLK